VQPPFPGVKPQFEVTTSFTASFRAAQELARAARAQHEAERLQTRADAAAAKRAEASNRGGAKSRSSKAAALAVAAPQAPNASGTRGGRGGRGSKAGLVGRTPALARQIAQAPRPAPISSPVGPARASVVDAEAAAEPDQVLDDDVATLAIDSAAADQAAEQPADAIDDILADVVDSAAAAAAGRSSGARGRRRASAPSSAAVAHDVAATQALDNATDAHIQQSVGSDAILHVSQRRGRGGRRSLATQSHIQDADAFIPAAGTQQVLEDDEVVFRIINQPSRAGRKRKPNVRSGSLNAEDGSSYAEGP